MDKKFLKLQKVIEKENLVKKGSLAVANELVKVEDSIDEVKEVINAIKQNIDFVKKEKGESGEDGKDGKDGEDYILTEEDKKEIASLVEVPVVEKIIEKVEKIKEVVKSEPVDTENIALKASKIVSKEFKEVLDGILRKDKEISIFGIKDTQEFKDSVVLDVIKKLPDSIKTVKTGMSSGIRYLKWLSDVSLSSLSNNDLLVYDNTLKKFTNKALSQIAFSSATANTLAYFDANKLLTSATVDGGLSFSGGILSVALSSPLGTIDISSGSIDFNGNSYKNYSLRTYFPYELSSDVDDLDAEQKTLVIVTPTASGYKINGVRTPAELNDFLIIVNKTEESFIISHQAVSSTLEYRFTLPNLTDLTVDSHEGVFFVYDSADKTWRYVGKTGGSSSLPALSNAKIWIGDASDVATEQTVSGDMTLSNTGVATIANNAVTFAKMQTITDGNLLGASGGTAVEQITPDTNYFSMTSNTLGFKTNATSGQVLYQGASALDGAVALEIDSNGNPNIIEDTTVSNPSSGVTLFTKSNTGRRMLGQKDVSGDSYRYQPSVVDKIIRYTQALGGNTSTVHNIGITSAITGSSAGVALGTGSYFAQVNRLAINAAAASGSSATNRSNGLIVYRGNSAGRGGFYFSSRGGVGSAASNATLRWWTGLYGTNSAIGNVEPDTLLNMVGFGINAGETTIRFYTNDGSGTASRTDLGANFPANALSTDMYNFEIWCAPNSSEIFWRCTRENTGDVANGSVTSDLPTNTVFLHPQVWINTGTTATAVSWHFSKMTLESNN